MSDPTLRELNLRLCEFEKRVDLRFEAADKALLLQSKEIERRLDGLNGEQSRLAAERTHFLPREIFETFKERVSKSAFSEEGRTGGMKDLWGWIFGVTMLIVAVVSLIYKVR